MPADFTSLIALILLNGAETVERLGPYVVGGIIAAVLCSRLLPPQWKIPPLSSRWPIVPLAAAAGAASPLPTTGMVPLMLRLREEGLPKEAALAFILASSLMNPQLFILTLGAMGPSFALAQLGAVLVLSTALGMVFGAHRPPERIHLRDEERRTSLRIEDLAEHMGLYFLLGTLAGATLQVLLPWTGALDWLAEHGLLSIPLLGWLEAPFYTCGGSAIPLARSLAAVGFSPGALFTFLLVGPSLRGTTLANLGCLLRRRTLPACLAALIIAGGILGWGFDLAMGVMK